jgi:hypothetical protein
VRRTSTTFFALIVLLGAAGCGGSDKPKVTKAHMAHVEDQLRVAYLYLLSAGAHGVPGGGDLQTYLENKSQKLADLVRDNLWLGPDKRRKTIDDALRVVGYADCSRCADILRSARP